MGVGVREGGLERSGGGAAPVFIATGTALSCDSRAAHDRLRLGAGPRLSPLCVHASLSRTESDRNTSSEGLNVSFLLD